MDMKKLLESMNNIEECGVDEGMPMVPPMSPQPQEDKGNPVTVNVSMNASGKEHVADLLNMMKNAGLKDAEPVGPAMMPMRQDMERLAGIMNDPKIPGKDDVSDMGCNDDIEIDDAPVAEYDNEPDEQYKSIDDIINSGDDLHKTKKAYAATQDGDNPMAVEGEEVSDEMNGMISDLVEKFSKFRGGNGDRLPDGYIQWALNSGIATDFVEENEAEAMREKYGEEEFENDPLGHVDEMPITKSFMDEIEKITGDDDIDTNARIIDKVQSGDADVDETTYAIKGKSPEAQEELARKASEEATLESSIKEELWAKLSNMKFDEGRGRGKKKAKEDTNEQKTEKCPECGKAGKVKLMACASCGCS